MSDDYKLELKLETKFREGIPLGTSQQGQNASVFTHYTFVVWYKEYLQGVEITGVEVVAQQPTLITPDLAFLSYSYSVSWKLSPEQVSSSLFPKWGAVAHSEWFVFFNTASVILCCVMSIAAFAVVQFSDVLGQTEEHLTSIIASRHSSVQPAHLPLKFLFLYMAVAMTLFCLLVLLLLILSTMFSLYSGSGSLYRFVGIMFPVLVVASALLSGFSAISFTGFLKRREMHVISSLLVVAAGSWLVTIPLVALDVWLWGAKFLAATQWLLLLAIFGMCCCLMWLGAFVAHWATNASAPKKTTTPMSNHV